MVTPNKQKIFTKALSVLGKRYSDRLDPNMSVLDHLLFGVIQEGTAPSRAVEIYRKVLAGFHDFNEMRVSHPAEMEELLGGVPDPPHKARRLLDILRFVFETTYAFDLESMKRKPLKQAEKQLSKITGSTPFAVAATVQRALNGHALPLDEPMCLVLAELQLIHVDDEPAQIRSSLEHLVPKAKGESFCLLIGELAADEGTQRSELIAEILGRGRRKAGEAPSEEAVTPAADMREKPTPSSKAGKKGAALPAKQVETAEQSEQEVNEAEAVVLPLPLPGVEGESLAAPGRKGNHAPSKGGSVPRKNPKDDG